MSVDSFRATKRCEQHKEHALSALDEAARCLHHLCAELHDVKRVQEACSAMRSALDAAKGGMDALTLEIRVRFALQCNPLVRGYVPFLCKDVDVPREDFRMDALDKAP